MPEIKMPYGRETLTFNMDDKDILAIVRANKPDLPHLTSKQAVRKALDNPIDSPRIAEIVKPGEKICVIAPDITRSWESVYISAPLVLEELNRAGVKDEDITFLCACGTHRRQTAAEHAQLLGEDVARRVKVIDHQCHEKENMQYMGKTSRGTPVEFNKAAVNADKIITLCGVVYHFLAGFGGGGKMLLPGIAADETIQHNHELALNPGFGDGNNPEVRSGNISQSNPFHEDIIEAAKMLPPAFSLNVVVDDKFNIIKAFAGDWQKAHLEACKLVGAMDGVAVPTRADLVIASAGGFPKDINLYQGIKLLNNAVACASDNSTIILVAKFEDDFGNEDCRNQIMNYDNMNAREKALRSSFSIGAYAGFLCAEAGEKYKLVLVTDMPAQDFAKTSIHAVKTLDEALALAAKLNGGKLPTPAIVMPHGATTLPMPGK